MRSAVRTFAFADTMLFETRVETCCHTYEQVQDRGVYKGLEGLAFFRPGRRLVVAASEQIAADQLPLLPRLAVCAHDAVDPIIAHWLLLSGSICTALLLQQRFSHVSNFPCCKSQPSALMSRSPFMLALTVHGSFSAAQGHAQPYMLYLHLRIECMSTAYRGQMAWRGNVATFNPKPEIQIPPQR